MDTDNVVKYVASQVLTPKTIGREFFYLSVG